MIDKPFAWCSRHVLVLALALSRWLQAGRSGCSDAYGPDAVAFVP